MQRTDTFGDRNNNAPSLPALSLFPNYLLLFSPSQDPTVTHFYNDNVPLSTWN